MESSNINSSESNNNPKCKELSPELQSVGSPAGTKFSIPDIPAWARWAIGSVVCVALPFYKRILKIEDGVEKAAETMVEVVEKVAEVAEKVTSDVADALPEGSAKQVVLEVEQAADEIDKEAKKVQEFLIKADKIEDEVEDLVEPIIEEGERMEKENQNKKESALNLEK